jgi:hypothetical protein
VSSPLLLSLPCSAYDPSIYVPASCRRESGSGACLDLQVIDTVRSGRDREDAVMHHLLCGGLYKPRRRVRADRVCEAGRVGQGGGRGVGKAVIRGSRGSLVPAVVSCRCPVEGFRLVSSKKPFCCCCCCCLGEWIGLL